MNSEIVKSSRLKPNTGQVDGLPKNPRIIKDERFKKLCKSIEEHPEMMDLREVIAYDSGEGLVVIAGNMRLKACNELGIKDIPTKILPRETPIEKLKAYAIKDNIPYGEWDWEALKDSFPEFELAELGFTFEPVEFEEPDIEIMDTNGRLAGGNYGDVSSNGIPINIMGIGGICDRDIVTKARQRLIEMGANEESDNGAIINDMFKGWIGQ